MKPDDKHHPFFAPLWRRIAIVLVVAGWLVFELLGPHDPIWITAAAGSLAYSIWSFLITWPKPPPPTEP
ncbi:hypothetical protein BH10PSE7_BH10PSE7_22680 [soil metagenome]